MSSIPASPIMQRPSQLQKGRRDPLDALCRHMNVRRVHPPAGSDPLPSTFDVPIRSDEHVPTHLLAVSETRSPQSCLLVPIHAGLWTQTFRVDIFPANVSEPGSTLPVPHYDSATKSMVVSLPVVPLSAPHPTSFALLVLFGTGLESPSNALSAHLLPSTVIAEFPSAATMSQVMSGLHSEDLALYLHLNQGLWQNCLAFGPLNERIPELIGMTWNVTNEARRIVTRRASA